MTQMQIFDESEKDLFEAPPVFNRHEQKQFFILPPGLDAFIQKGLRTPTNRVCFVIVLGYFRATKRFFPNQFYEKDIQFVAEQLHLSRDQVNAEFYDRRSFHHHKKIILDHFGFRKFSNKVKTSLQKEIQLQLRSQVKPKLIMLEVFKFLIRRRIKIPGYNALSTMIAVEIDRHERGLSKLIRKQLAPSQRTMLDGLLEKDDPDNRDLKTQRYELTLMKKIDQSMKPSKIKASVDDLQIFGDLFQQIESIVGSLGLTDEGIKHYAQSVIRSRSGQISRKDKENRYLHLIAFITYQYYKLHDTLIDILLLSVQNVLNSATQGHKDRYYDDRYHNNEAVHDVINYCGRNLQTFSAIRTYIVSGDLSDRQKIELITAVLDQGENREKKMKDQLKRIESEVTHGGRDFHSILESKSVTSSRSQRLRASW